MEKSFNMGTNLFTSNIGVLSHVLRFYALAHQSAFVMSRLWSGSRLLLNTYDFAQILKDLKKKIILNYKEFQQILSSDFLKRKNINLFDFTLTLDCSNKWDVLQLFENVKERELLVNLKTFLTHLK